MILLAFIVLGLSCLVGGVLLALGINGGSLRCMLQGHQRSTQIWTCRDSSGVGYSCPRCGILWLPSDPFDQLKP